MFSREPLGPVNALREADVVCSLTASVVGAAWEMLGSEIVVNTNITIAAPRAKGLYEWVSMMDIFFHLLNLSLNVPDNSLTFSES